MKKSISIILAIIIAVSAVLTLNVFAEDNITYAAGITKEMCSPSYWYNKGIGDADKVLMTNDEIAAVNQGAIDGKGTNVVGVFNIKDTYDATAAKKSVSNIDIPTRALYVDGTKIDNQQYFGKMISAIKETGFEGTRQTLFAVTTARADLIGYPTDDFIGYSATDPDNEYQSSGLCINEPFAIRQKCEIDGKTFYWGYSLNCTGWINAEKLAICKDREEWFEACRFDLGSDDFIVVTADKIITEPSTSTPYSSEVKLTFGSLLRLVPEDKIPEKIGERGSWNNYVIYLPTRDENGMYSAKPALIPMHANVHIGFLPFTQANILDVSFSCLGNRYGWGGMLDSMDCSLYTRNIYRCFGFEIPRNTTWQQNIPDTLISLSGLDDTQREQLMETLPIGTLLYFSGHAMMYIGSQDKTNYVISDVGTIIDSVGELNIKNVYSVIINPLTVRRGNGYTWLHNLTSVVMLTPRVDISECAVDTYRDENGEISVSVTYEGKELYENVNYTVEITENTAKISGINNFNGEASFNVPKQKIGFFKKIANFFKKFFNKITSIFR